VGFKKLQKKIRRGKALLQQGSAARLYNFMHSPDLVICPFLDLHQQFEAGAGYTFVSNKNRKTCQRQIGY
jgi:hypothetical protein